MSRLLEQAVADLADALDRLTACPISGPDGVSGPQAADLLARLSQQASRLGGVNVQLAGVVEESGVWGLDGSRSAAAYLSRATRASRASTGSDLKLAKALAGPLPLTAQAVAHGVVPVEHARAIAQLGLGSQRCVELMACPDRGEAFLLAHAHLRLDEYRTFLKTWAYRADPDAADRHYREAGDDFDLQVSVTADYTLLRGTCSPVLGELLITALGAETGIPAKHDQRSPGRRRHDALASILTRALNSGQLGELAACRPQLVAHVDYPTLAMVLAHARNDPDLAGLPGLTGLRAFEGLPPAVLQESGLPVPVSVLRRLLCDSDLIRVVFGPARQVLDVGRAQRTFTGPRRQALNARDGGCVWPGCHAPPWMCQGAHTPPGGWAAGAGTNAANGALLCYVHHPHVDDHRIAMTRTADGGWAFHHPDGTYIGTSYPRLLGTHLPGNGGPIT